MTDQVGSGTPALVVEPDQLTAPDSSPTSMSPIPGSRMFEIKEALAVYRGNNPDGEVFDASQGDGGASLPGVPLEILERAHELQVEHGPVMTSPSAPPCFARRWSRTTGGWTHLRVGATQCDRVSGRARRSGQGIRRSPVSRPRPVGRLRSHFESSLDFRTTGVLTRWVPT